MADKVGPMKKTRQSGASIVEFAVVLPLLVLLFAGTAHFGIIIFYYTRVDKAVHDAARYAALRTYSEQPGDAGLYHSQVVNTVYYGNPAGTGAIVAPGITSSGVSVTFTRATPGVRPRTVTVSLDDYSVPGLIGDVALANKPSATFPFMGRYVPPTLP